MEKYVVYPQIDHDSAPYWDYLRKHEARLQKCDNCRRFRFPPSPNCPYCGTIKGEWTAISGKATLYSWVIIWRPVDPRLQKEIPVTIAMVDLKEGARIAGRLLGCSPEQVKAGMCVKARYDDVDDRLTLLNFEATTNRLEEKQREM